MSTLAELLSIYTWPSQALWRHLEVRALRRLSYERPILEIGCGSGELTAMILDRVDEAIDLNPRAVERCRDQCGRTYAHVRCLDARELTSEKPRFRTVFANCVLEHIPDLGEVLRGCHAALLDGGRLVATVPLEEMNGHLLIRSEWYAKYRRNQLRHVNLWPLEGWKSQLLEAGFESVTSEGYLYPAACALWDKWDAVASLGYGRYTVATAVGRVLLKPLGKGGRRRIFEKVARRLAGTIAALPEGGAPCAALLVATKEGVSKG